MGAEDLDPLGAKALAETTKIVADKAMTGVGAFLGKVCMPVAEEFGLLLQDKVKSWRAANAVRIIEKAKARLEQEGSTDPVHVHPRLAGKIIEKSSWVDADHLQDMWAGLFASSCTPSGTDDSNLTFINLLDQLTASEARLVEFVCKGEQIHVSEHRLVLGDTQKMVPLDGLRKVTGIESASELDIALDHLHGMGLLVLGSGFNFHSTPPVASLTPTALCLNMFARTQGFTGDPYDFYEKLTPLATEISPPSSRRL
ncbi:Abi-alpha family protein [Paraburkholderia sp. EG287A]